MKRVNELKMMTATAIAATMAIAAPGAFAAPAFEGRAAGVQPMADAPVQIAPDRTMRPDRAVNRNAPRERSNERRTADRRGGDRDVRQRVERTEPRAQRTQPRTERASERQNVRDVRADAARARENAVRARDAAIEQRRATEQAAARRGGDRSRVQGWNEHDRDRDRNNGADNRDRRDRDGRDWRDRRDNDRGNNRDARNWRSDRQDRYGRDNDSWRDRNGSDWRDRDRDRDRNNNRWRDRDPRGDRYTNRSRWDDRWRNNNRYDWQRYRTANRTLYRMNRYQAPYRDYRYNRFNIGISIGAPFYSSRYWINDPWRYRLPAVYDDYRWVRYYDDVLLVDTYTGRVVDVIYDFFW